MDIFGVWFLFPLWIIIWIILFSWATFVYLSKKQTSNFWDMDLISEVYETNSKGYKIFVACIWLITLLFILALGWPYMSFQSKDISKNGVDIEIVFDLSYSMVATDLSPSRLEVAKNVLTTFIEGIESDRVGLILFSGKPFQSIPLTYDYDFITTFISEISIETINQQYQRLQGTAIWDGLVLANDVLMNADSEREKVIILITDGEANKWINPELALKLLSDSGIKVYSIWVWKDEETSVQMETAPGIYQRVLIGWVDETILKKISSTTWGAYFRADSETTFAEILDTISELEKKEQVSEHIFLKASLLHFILFPLVLLLLAVTYIMYIKKIIL